MCFGPDCVITKIDEWDQGIGEYYLFKVKLIGNSSYSVKYDLLCIFQETMES